MMFPKLWGNPSVLLLDRAKHKMGGIIECMEHNIMVPSKKKTWQRLYKYVYLTFGRSTGTLFSPTFLYCVAKGLCNRDDEMHIDMVSYVPYVPYTQTMMYDARFRSSEVFKRVSS